jgi:type IV fimbrial biogenesis protein FimT
MKRRGFTLVELLVVLAVGSILLAIAVPGYGFLVSTSRLAAVTNDLVSNLQLARSEAVKRGMRVTVCKTGNAMAVPPACDATAGWHQGWLVFVDDGAQGVIDANDSLLRVHERAHADVLITANSHISRFISYLPDGRSRGMTGLGNGTFEVCVSGSRRDIIINNAGRPRLESGSC